MILKTTHGYPVFQLMPHAESHGNNRLKKLAYRKKFKISDKSIEAANLTNTYYINCEGMDSAEFGTSSERWFNPTIGLIEQIELMSVERKSNIEESTAILTSIS